MNRVHRFLCRSDFWRKTLEEKVMPWVLTGVDLGQEVLEVGPGPGLTTDLLRRRFIRMTALEIDSRLARALAARLDGSNVRIIHGDATNMPFEDGTFTGALACTMLHHVPSPSLQDQLFREVGRVLKPGGVFAGVDSRQSFLMRVLHVYDTLVPVDPRTLGARLEAAGFEDVSIEINETSFRFRAKRRQEKR